MRWSRTLQLVDVHCGGEIGRVLMSGMIDIPGATMAEKLEYVNEVNDNLRRLILNEPRGSGLGAVVPLVPATRPDADIGMMVWLPDQAYAMSGSNAMCAATALLETGTVAITEPETKIVFDTASGLVTAVATCKDGKAVSVRISMPDAFVQRSAVVISTGNWVDISIDVCFGGVYYALVDAMSIGLSICAENAKPLAQAGMILRDLARQQVKVQHPLHPELDAISHLMFHETTPDGAMLTCTTVSPGRADRSACGTGSAALAARQVRAGFLDVGETLKTRSVIGSEFATTVTGLAQIGDKPAVKTDLTGLCWIYGLSQIGLDPSDPYPQGFML